MLHPSYGKVDFDDSLEYTEEEERKVSMDREGYLKATEELDMIENALKTIRYKLLTEKSKGYKERLVFEKVKEAVRNVSDAQELIRDIIY